jgi:hypothetical protein
MPGAAGCDHATQGFEDMRGDDQVDGEDRLREACVGDSPAVWITCTTGPQLGGGAGGEGVDGGSAGDVDVGCLCVKPAVCYIAMAKLSPKTQPCAEG